MVAGRVGELTVQFHKRIEESDANGIPHIWRAITSLDAIVNESNQQTRLKFLDKAGQAFIGDTLGLPRDLGFLMRMLIDKILIYMNLAGWGRNEIVIALDIQTWRQQYDEQQMVQVNCEVDTQTRKAIDLDRQINKVIGERHYRFTKPEQPPSVEEMMEAAMCKAQWLKEQREHDETYQTLRELQEMRDSMIVRMLSGKLLAAKLEPGKPFCDCAVGVPPTFTAWQNNGEPVRLGLNCDRINPTFEINTTYDLKSGEGIRRTSLQCFMITSLQKIYHTDPVTRAIIMSFVDSDGELIGQDAYGVITAIRNIFMGMGNGSCYNNGTYITNLCEALRRYGGGFVQYGTGTNGLAEFLKEIKEAIRGWYSAVLGLEIDAWELNQCYCRRSVSRVDREDERIAREGEVAVQWNQVLIPELVGLLENPLLQVIEDERQYWNTVRGIHRAITADRANIRLWRDGVEKAHELWLTEEGKRKASQKRYLAVAEREKEEHWRKFVQDYCEKKLAKGVLQFTLEDYINLMYHNAPEQLRNRAARKYRSIDEEIRNESTKRRTEQPLQNQTKMEIMDSIICVLDRMMKETEMRKEERIRNRDESRRQGEIADMSAKLAQDWTWEWRAAENVRKDSEEWECVLNLEHEFQEAMKERIDGKEKEQIGTYAMETQNRLIKLPGQLHLVIRNGRKHRRYEIPEKFTISDISGRVAWYKLKDVTIHYGNGLVGGHYNILIKNSNGKWWQADDGRVFEIDKTKAELLIYGTDSCYDFSANIATYIRETRRNGG
jgi:hypothetical protein